MSRKGQEASGNGSRADREQSTADCLSEYKLAACAWPSQVAILETTSVVYKLEIALLATSVESSAISLLRGLWSTEGGILSAQHAMSGHYSRSACPLLDFWGMDRPTRILLIVGGVIIGVILVMIALFILFANLIATRR
jgi:hypothetical protein